MTTTIRPLTPEIDNRGDPVWHTRLSAPDDSYAQIKMIPDRVIPVIFVPGVMGSNLKGLGKSKKVEWLLDSKSSMKGWLIRGAEFRKEHLTPATMRVVDTGKIDPGNSGIPVEELKRRGWGEVGFMSYGDTLPWLETSLNDYQTAETGERAKLKELALQALVGESTLTQDEFELSYKYRFPVYACGYNWLDSNSVAAARLGSCIDAVIARYKNEKKKCEKVIVVTHSMGGLVARHCSEVGNYQSKIFGIVHGVMPAIGAAAVYRRFKAGTEGAYIASEVLGNDAAEMTAVLSSAPGPMQLLPTPEYGNGWLKIKDGATEHSLPKSGDPYGEIYTVRGKWWSMAEDHLINPLNKEPDSKKRQTLVDADWLRFSDLIHRYVKTFHTDIKANYHPNTHAFIGNDAAFKAYGNVTWSGSSLFNNKRPTDALERPALTPVELKEKNQPEQEIKGYRSVQGHFTDGGWFANMERTFFISEPEEPGDGTVPQRSGLAARAACKTFMQVKVEHEPAYNHKKGDDNLRACRFTLRAIVKIAQDVQQSALKYD